MSSVPTFEEIPETERGRILYQMLLAVHGIRGELASVGRLAAAVVDGMSVEGVNEELEALRNETTLWQFQVGCLRYCRFVHSHHHAEDTDFFDELEETNPAIRPVVERLRAEHRAVSDDLGAVEAAARALRPTTTASMPDAPSPTSSGRSKSTCSRTSSTRSETSPPRPGGYATCP